MSRLRLDPAGWPFIAGALVLAIVTGAIGGLAFAAPLAALGAFFAFFFRDPERAVGAAPSEVLSPADGRVLVAGAAEPGVAPPGTWQQISIFLSPMDVHVNRMPVAGRVVSVKYHPGRFLPAYRADAGDLNEYTEVTLDCDGQTVVVRQIVGILARRIVCRAKEGDVVRAGDRFGVMKFGSRMDIFLPAGTTVHTAVGERVVAGITIVATLPAGHAAPTGKDGTTHAS